MNLNLILNVQCMNDYRRHSHRLNCLLIDNNHILIKRVFVHLKWFPYLAYISIKIRFEHCFDDWITTNFHEWNHFINGYQPFQCCWWKQSNSFHFVDCYCFGWFCWFVLVDLFSKQNTNWKHPKFLQEISRKTNDYMISQENIEFSLI